MQTAEALVLGLVQALTEFLPVSSSGHLRLGHALFGTSTEIDLSFDILLHVGTLLAVVLVYHRSLGTHIREFFAGLPLLKNGVGSAFRQSPGLRFALLVGLATVPTAIIGYALKDWVESSFFSTPVVGALLIVNGFILALSMRYPGDEEPDESPYSIAGIGPREALLIGVVQGMAVLPGISRSGSTIVMALALGAPRMKAAEMSFLLSIPAIVGAVVLKFSDGFTVNADDVVPYALGTAVSAVVGVLALIGLLGLLRRAQMHVFRWYCWALGLTAIVLYVVRG